MPPKTYSTSSSISNTSGSRAPSISGPSSSVTGGNDDYTSSPGGGQEGGLSQHSLRQLVRSQITDYSRLTNTLLTQMSTMVDGRPTLASPKDLIRQIVKLDATLMGAVEKIEVHQRQQRRIRQVQLEIEAKNKAIMDLVQNLLKAKQVLESKLENLEDKKAATKEARSAEISVTEIIAYGNRLSAYTSAPPNFDPANGTLQFEPPYPREVQMRAGILNQQHIPAKSLVQLDGSTMPGVPPGMVDPATGGLGNQQQQQQQQQQQGQGQGQQQQSQQQQQQQQPGQETETFEEDDDDDDGDDSDGDEKFTLYETLKGSGENSNNNGRKIEEDDDDSGAFDLDLS